jgi:hypothetical protein
VNQDQRLGASGAKRPVNLTLSVRVVLQPLDMASVPVHALGEQLGSLAEQAMSVTDALGAVLT